MLWVATGSTVVNMYILYLLLVGEERNLLWGGSCSSIKWPHVVSGGGKHISYAVSVVKQEKWCQIIRKYISLKFKLHSLDSFSVITVSSNLEKWASALRLKLIHLKILRRVFFRSCLLVELLHRSVGPSKGKCRILCRLTSLAYCWTNYEKWKNIQETIENLKLVNNDVR